MATFSVLVEVEFAGGVWTDVSAYVRAAEGISIRRGRTDEQGEIQPGTMTLTLINDGRFTPGLASSPYYPNVKKGRRIRCSVVVGVTTYRRYDGYVNEWPVEWEGGTALSLVNITCTDLFKRLGLLAPMKSLLEEEFLYLEPDAYYTLGEESDTTSAGDTSGHSQASMKVYQVAGASGVVDFGAAEGPGTDDLPAPLFTPFSATQGKGLRADLDAAAPTGLVVACWLNTTTSGRDFLQVCNRFTGVGGAASVLNIDVDGTLRVVAFDGDDFLGGDFGSILATDLADGADHFVAVHINTAGGVFITIDDTTPGGGLSYGAIPRIDVYDRIVAGGFKDPLNGASNLYSGTLSHIWWKRTNTMPDWSFVWSAGNGDTESTTDRFTRLRGLLNLGGAVLGSSTTQMDPQASGGKAPIEALRDVAAVEGGLVYASRSAAELLFECRNYRYNKASALTLTVTDVQGDLTWSDDDQPLVNDVTNRRDGGADQRVTDAASIAAYGIYSGGQSQPWASDYDALAAAQWEVYKGADPPPRVTQVGVKANTIAQHVGVLGLDLSDVVTLSGLPATAPATSVALHIEGYDERIEIGMHTISFNTSPAATSAVWQIGVAGRSELGLTTRLAL
ncbi:hypothetical protein [Streptosporangium sp. NPDC048865]|uniref:hypothetical protein n=1 Tax=Streptosporangium sp. NPDC048865 TaxID=3155766 RepID=UPI003422CA8E